MSVSVIESDDFLSELLTLQEVTFDNLQRILQELWYEKKANPQFLFISAKDQIELSVECTRWNMRITPQLVEGFRSLTTGRLIHICVQDTFSQGTIEFRYLGDK